MRISDWSSDVCSSDLGVGVGLSSLCMADGPHPLRLGQQAGKSRCPPLKGRANSSVDPVGHPLRRHDRARGDAVGDGAIAEIGRASGRERVCQYVSISVVAGALTKKKQIENNNK